MLKIEIAVAIFIIAAFIHFQVSKRKANYQTALLANHIDKSDELKRTLAMGLYLRFRNEKEEYKPFIEENGVFIKQDPITFESFVAEVFEAAKGGNTWQYPATGDFGVDFEHDLEDGRYLGQVKCFKRDMGFEPIALLHSNMVKQNAKGGYVITTSSFTKAAKEYAEGLNIELIDGIQLVDLWLEGLENQEEEIKDIIPV